MQGQEDIDVNAILVGGPSDLPAAARQRRVAPGSAKVKVMHRGGYEHFEPDTAAGPRPGQVIYRWTGRTNIAE